MSIKGKFSLDRLVIVHPRMQELICKILSSC
ncbi:hypothetical protein T01_12148 [Trichinella spiralis]|uniref:Uncharacterized protein n=1 Tax=Trichinella spiralis TaxID=6334 RepID=A0A0V1AIJ0_TRISP|nr:hypothetical protein T01_12148 [Trichinella spiralis]